MLPKNFLRDYLSFSYKDRLAALILAGLILLTLFLPYLFPSRLPSDLNEADLVTLSDSLQGELNVPQEGKIPKNAPTVSPVRLFTFDPNKLDEAGWIQLGLPPRTARTILNYRSKGGHFYKKEDLKRIWGLPEGFYNQVENYIRLEEEVRKPAYKPGNSGMEKRPERKLDLDINLADTTAFIALPGIGSKLALRITSFREALGGFYSVDQVGETFGLPDSTFQKIRKWLRISGTVKRVAVNTATAEELRKHPYIRWKGANAIVSYRNQHGAFKTLEELKMLASFPEGMMEKLLPYLVLE